MADSKDLPPHTMSDAHKAIYDEGLKVRYAVAGPEYVNKALKDGSTSFTQPMQELVTAAAWGMIWTRPGLQRKQRSMLNLAMLCALNRPAELAIHVRGAITNGVTETELSEVFLQVATYCGMPAGIEGLKVAKGVLERLKAEKIAKPKL